MTDLKLEDFANPKMEMLSEFSENGLVVQVGYFGTDPKNYGVYSRYSVLTEKTGWSKFLLLRDCEFQYVDRQASKKANGGNAAPFYAEIYHSLIV